MSYSLEFDNLQAALSRKKAILMNILIGTTVFQDLKCDIKFEDDRKKTDYKVTANDHLSQVISANTIKSLEDVEIFIDRVRHNSSRPISCIDIEGRIPENYAGNYKYKLCFQFVGVYTTIKSVMNAVQNEENKVFIYMVSKDELHQNKNSHLQRLADIIKDDETYYNKFIWLLDVGLEPEGNSHFFDKEMAELQKTVMLLHEKLTNIGLKKPKIIPINLLDGQIIQKVKQGHELSAFESVEYPWLQSGVNRRRLEQYALIDSDLRILINKRSDVYRQIKDTSSELLLHSGIAVLKAVIEKMMQESEIEIEEQTEQIQKALDKKQNLSLEYVLASTQILMFNPIMKENLNTREQYFMYLKKMVSFLGWNRRKYTKAQVIFYKEKLCGEQKDIEDFTNYNFDKKFCYLLPFDLAVMTGFNPNSISDAMKAIHKIVTDFKLSYNFTGFLQKEFEAACGIEEHWHAIIQCRSVESFKMYLQRVKHNAVFMKEQPFHILITATMSAGKSTLINALVGKNISRMQNMACTSKIHTIIAKPFEDAMTSEYDYNIVLDASRDELLNDNDANRTSKIVVGTYFNSLLGGQRIVLFDSPGVNSNEHSEHTIISQRMIKSEKYELLLYILNATQLGTTDDEEHLEVVAEELDHTNVIFVMNKADHLLGEEENISDIIERQRKFLISKGFHNPVICPVSARAAYLAKKSLSDNLSRIEKREMDIHMDRFERYSLTPYYKKILGDECDKSVNEFMPKTFGISVDLIGTMNSGKSTLINAMLRRKLIPTKNVGCTAVVTEIIDTDAVNFSAIAYNRDNEILHEISELNCNIMSHLQADRNVHRIEVKGDIPFLDSSNMALTLVDLPGPNNARDGACKATTYRSINNDLNNLILYVLNATQLINDDDASLLHYVADQIKKGGKQVRDRCMIVINKMELLNPEEENIEKIIQSVKDCLASYGIDDPQLFPCAAFTALNIKTDIAGIDIDNLTRAQERQLPISARDTLLMIDKFLQFESMHLEKYSTLSLSAQQELNFRLSQAIEAGDTKEQALVHSGIYSIELAIKEYAEKYIEDNEKNKAKILLENSGFTYLEKIIKYLSEGGKVNDTGIR